MRVAFADESGTSGRERCYTIGVLHVPKGSHRDLEFQLQTLAARHGIVGEVKWKKVAKSHGLVNFGLDVMKRVIETDCCFSAIVVNKALYRKWLGDKEQAFYTTYTQILRQCARDFGGVEFEVYIDNRKDSYDKQHEVVEIIGNYMLANLSASGRLSNVSKADSRDSICVQVADFLTGAINHAHHRYLNPDLQMSRGKKVFISRMAEMLGWDDVIYDTYPNRDLNIWHFPIEWRAKPATRNIRANLDVAYVRPEEVGA